LLAALTTAALTAIAAAQSAAPAMFPLLVERSADLRFVAVETQRYSIVFERTEDGWVAADRGGYPVTPAPVEELAATLAAFTTAELVTDDPADHPALDVIGPGPESDGNDGRWRDSRRRVYRHTGLHDRAAQAFCGPCPSRGRE
jgi:hypothetical protein